MIHDAQYIAAARKKHHASDGTLEIDDLAKVSRSSDSGAYVQAWLWVYDTDTEETA
jgi:hypothetical protein